MKWLARIGERLASLGRPDLLRDYHVYGGLLLAAVGGWHLSRPWTLVVVGIVLAALGLLTPGPRRTSR